jgi:hypothetical protein
MERDLFPSTTMVSSGENRTALPLLCNWSCGTSCVEVATSEVVSSGDVEAMFANRLFLDSGRIHSHASFEGGRNDGARTDSSD